MKPTSKAKQKHRVVPSSSCGIAFPTINGFVLCWTSAPRTARRGLFDFSPRMVLRWVFAFCFLVCVQSGPLPTTGVCTRFDTQPQACQFILNNVSVWTLPGNGLTQEFWESLMVTPNPNSSFSVLGSLPVRPFECATAYL